MIVNVAEPASCVESPASFTVTFIVLSSSSDVLNAPMVTTPLLEILPHVEPEDIL